MAPMAPAAPVTRIGLCLKLRSESFSGVRSFIGASTARSSAAADRASSSLCAAADANDKR